MSQHVRVTWAGGQRFDAGRPGGPVMRLDGSADTAPSPVDALLNALAACIAVDVIEILHKRRTPVHALTVDVTATRVQTIPRHLKQVTLTFVIDGDGIDRVHAERAVDLSITKYCSVRDSLRPDIHIDWSVTLNGVSGDTASAPGPLSATMTSATSAHSHSAHPHHE